MDLLTALYTAFHGHNIERYETSIMIDGRVNVREFVQTTQGTMHCVARVSVDEKGLAFTTPETSRHTNDTKAAIGFVREFLEG